MSNIKITVPFVECASSIPMIKVKVGNMWTNAIIDSGAESTLIGADMIELPEVHVLEEDLIANFTGIGDYKNKKIVQLGTDIEIAGHKFAVAAYQFDLSGILSHLDRICDYNDDISFVLGSDFLTKYDAVIDYEDKIVTITV